MPRNERQLTRSVRLRKYGTTYKKHMRSQERDAVPSGSNPRVHRTRHHHRRKHSSHKSPSPKKKERKKKPLNNWQKFVKKESGKEKYRKMRGSERLSAIAVDWENQKKKLSKKVEKYKKRERKRVSKHK